MVSMEGGASGGVQSDDEDETLADMRDRMPLAQSNQPKNFTPEITQALEVAITKALAEEGHHSPDTEEGAHAAGEGQPAPWPPPPTPVILARAIQLLTIALPLKLSVFEDPVKVKRKWLEKYRRRGRQERLWARAVDVARARAAGRARLTAFAQSGRRVWQVKSSSR